MERSPGVLACLPRFLMMTGILAVPAALANSTESSSSLSATRKGGLEEVVVTARRTAENLQDVPVAISAISNEDLRRNQINSPQDLQGRVPSLVVGTNSQMRNTESPTIRGQGAQFAASPGVIIYLAEVAMPSDPVANYQGGAGKFFDLANVQILKGSQGTLFGRNTTGGAMLLEPNKPEDALLGGITIGGNKFTDHRGADLSGQNIEGFLNVPLVDDALFMRIGGQIYQRDGFTEDVVTGKDYDNKDYWTVRFGLLWRPTEQIENYLMAYYSDSQDNGTATVIEDINREGLNRAIPGAIGAGGLTQLIPGLDLAQPANLGCQLLNFYGPSNDCGQDILDEQAARGPRKVQLSADPQDNLASGTILDNISLELNDNLTLRNIISYSTMVHSYRWDLDGSRAAINDFINPEDIDEADIRTYTEELQLQGSALDESLSFVLGAYYEKTKAEGAIVGTSLMFVGVNQSYEQNKSSFAPFAQATYDLGNMTDSLAGLSLTLGVRHTKDKNAGTAAIKQVASGQFPLVDAVFETSVTSSALTYTAGIDYKFDEKLIYGKVSRGYKTGGISPVSVNPENHTYEPEFVTNYEVGFKSDFESGMPIRLNTALYYTDYEDLQKAAADAYVDPNSPSPAPQLGQAVYNVGQAWVAGFEVDATIQASERLTLLGTFGYTKAEYQEYQVFYGGATPQVDCSGEEKERGSTLELSCLPFMITPEYQYSASMRYLLPIDETAGELEASLTYVWVDEQYGASTHPDGEPGAWLPDFGLLNGSLAWSQVFGSELSIQLYGSNLTNELYRISNSNQWNLTYIRSSIYSEPRVLGFSVGYRWE